MSTERFDVMMSNIAAAPGNDTEIDAMRTVAWTLWRRLTEDAQDEVFTDLDIAALEITAEEWAEESNGEPLGEPEPEIPAGDIMEDEDAHPDIDE